MGFASIVRLTYIEAIAVRSTKAATMLRGKQFEEFILSKSGAVAVFAPSLSLLPQAIGTIFAR